ncbi:MAG: hemerythrin domain-containing protein [Streptosporangiaceae bacterium]
MDVIDLILADHARLRRLFAVLEDAARYGEQPGARAMLSEAWARLAGLLELHAGAEEEICYLALFGQGAQAAAELQDALADHGGIREAVHEAGLHEVGDRAWWRAVTAAVRASSDHLASEEQGVLADFRRHAPLGLRDALGRQWVAFTIARTRDAAMPAARPRAGSEAARAEPGAGTAMKAGQACRMGGRGLGSAAAGDRIKVPGRAGGQAPAGRHDRDART